MKGKVASTALATAMITTLVVATPALANPLGATAEASASAQFTGHFGGGYGDADRAGSEYAATLVRAWGRGDTAQVDALATPDVASTLLAFANPGGARWVQTSSRGIAGVTFSSFVDRTQGKALIVGVEDSATDGDHAAIIARFVVIPQRQMTATEYAIDLVRAWGRGDAATVDALATPDVAATLRTFADPGGVNWVFTRSRSITGITFSSFVDRTQGKALVIGVQRSAIGGDHAAVIARFVGYAMPLVPRGDHTGMDGAERDLGARHTLRSSSFAGSR